MRGDVFGLHLPSNPMGKDSGFSASSPRKNQVAPRGRGYRLSLGIIKGFKYVWYVQVVTFTEKIYQA